LLRAWRRDIVGRVAWPSFDAEHDEVLVLHLRPSCIAEETARRVLLPRLSEAEQLRYARFRFDDDRHTYVVAHALLRSALARFAGVPVHALEFSVGAHGRPDPSAPPQAAVYRANLSHTTDYVACAFSRGLEVGVDVEYTARAVELLTVAERVFSRVELSGLRALSADVQRERFFDLWTLKEAYIKAIGKGLAAPLRAITFRAEQADPVPVSFAPEAEDDGARWRLRRYAPSSVHRLSVCWSGRDAAAIRCIEVSADQLLTA
jgi:4'-phosphopantetheinyl transferase